VSHKSGVLETKGGEGDVANKTRFGGFNESPYPDRKERRD